MGRSRGIGGAGRVWLGGYLLVAVVDLIAEAFELRRLAELAMWVLMPLLAGLLISVVRRRGGLLVPMLGALFFSWLGDTLGNNTMTLKIGFFLVAQWILITAFWRYRGRSVLFKPRFLLGYLAVITALVIIVGLDAGDLLMPVIIYGISLGAMAVLATGVNPIAALGGIIFMISDSLLALNSFVSWATIPHAGVLIMLSYLAAQLLLVFAVILASWTAPVTADQR